MIDDIEQISSEQVRQIEWQGDNMLYDLQLYELGDGLDEFIVFAPDPDVETLWHNTLKHYIEELPYSRKCIVFTYQGNWVAKIFKDGWYPYHGYETVEIVKPKFVWAKNPDIDKLMDFVDDPFGTYEPNKWERDYKLIWHIDPRFNPTDDKVWTMSVQTIGREVLGTKDMGYLTPNVNVEFNDHLPDLGVDIDECCPPFWELANECAYELDPVHQTDQQLWVVKFTPGWRTPKEWKWMGTVSPTLKIEYNPDLPPLDYELDYTIPWHDFTYEHVWMLDRKYLTNGEDDIWAFKVTVSADVEGSKVVDYISPNFNIEYNPVLPELTYDLDYTIPWHDFGYKHVWLLDRSHLNSGEEDIWALTLNLTAEQMGSKTVGYISPEVDVQINTDLPTMNHNLEYVIPWYDLKYDHVWYLEPTELSNDKIWAIRMKAVDEPAGLKELGTVKPLISENLDVIFISYHEPNAEENWERVLEKAPWAKRVDGVKGIFEAHKAAANLANTDMFFVVDGDAYLTYNWEFDFQPGIFDRDCTYVWPSKNPINNLTYGYGGVKLFARSTVKSLRSWGTDLTLSVGKKLKVMKDVSNITRFNTSEYDTWKSAFRECAKLSKKTDLESALRLQAWLSPVETAAFAAWAKQGAEQGVEFANANADITKVNDYEWLKEQFINNSSI